MATLQQRQLIETIAANGKVDSDELVALRSAFPVDGRTTRDEADLLVELFKRVERRSPAFEQFFYQAVKGHVLTDGKIDAEEAAWLRRLLWADGVIDDRERKFLHDLRGEAKEVSPEFQALFDACLKSSPEARTAGGRR